MSMEDTQIDKKEQKRLSVAGSRKRKMNHVNELEEVCTVNIIIQLT